MNKFNQLYEKIINENWDEGYPISVEELLTKNSLPVPPEAEPVLKNKLYWHKYNRNYTNGPGSDPHIVFTDNYFGDYESTPIARIEIGRTTLMFVDGKWEPYDRNKEYQPKKTGI